MTRRGARGPRPLLLPLVTLALCPASRANFLPPSPFTVAGMLSDAAFSAVPLMLLATAGA